MPQVVERRSKRYKEAAKKAVVNPLPIDQAIDAVKAFPPTKFDQSVELIFSLGIDAKQADQMIRGSLSLPHGVGKTKRVVAFCGENLVAGDQSDRRQRRLQFNSIRRTTACNSGSFRRQAFSAAKRSDKRHACHDSTFKTI